jgi:hypothetical protein
MIIECCDSFAYMISTSTDSDYIISATYDLKVSFCHYVCDLEHINMLHTIFIGMFII